MSAYRVIAFSAKNVGLFPTMNVVTSDVDAGTHAKNQKKQATQASAAVAAANPNLFKTIMAAAATTAGLPTVVIPGYSGPS